MKKLILFLLLAATTAEADDYLKAVSVTPTITAGAYTAGDSVGGLMTFENLACPNGVTLIKQIILNDTAVNAVEYNVYFYARTVGGTITNDSAFDPNDAAGAYEWGYVNLQSTDCVSRPSNTVCSLSSLSHPVISETSGENIFVALETEGTPTYASTSGVTLKIVSECRE